MPNLYSAADAAEQLKCVKSTVIRAAVASSIGSRAGRSWVFTATDIKSLRKIIRENRGCPNFTPGNELWKRQKKLEKSKRNA